MEPFSVHACYLNATNWLLLSTIGSSLIHRFANSKVMASARISKPVGVSPCRGSLVRGRSPRRHRRRPWRRVIIRGRDSWIRIGVWRSPDEILDSFLKRSESTLKGENFLGLDTEAESDNLKTSSSLDLAKSAADEDTILLGRRQRDVIVST